MSGDEEHISFETLVDFGEGRLHGSPAEQVQAHLHRCQHCAETLEWITSTINLMRTDSLEDAPSGVINRAVRTFAPPDRRLDPAGAIRRLVARLQFDSGGLTPAAGFRSGQPAPRQLLFSTDVADIDLRFTSNGQQWELSGQVLGDCQEGSVELLGGQVAQSATLDDLAEFRLPPVDAGTYRLVIRWSDIEVEVPGLVIGNGHGTS